MSGMAPKKPTKDVKSDQNTGPDDCDISCYLDLTAVDNEILKQVHVGDILAVELYERASIKSVVCVVPGTAKILGSLSAFIGLSRLVVCLTSKVKYQAQVTEIVSARCSVLLERV